MPFTLEMTMTQTAHEKEVEQLHPTPAAAPLLTGRSDSNFFVTPMGRGRPARRVENKAESEEDPVAGIGFSILGSVIGGALGLGPMFEIAFEAVKSGLEVGEGQISSSNFVEDVNLNPAALIDPSRAFNFKGLAQRPVREGEPKEREDEAKPKRSWNSGEGGFLMARLAHKRQGSVAANPVLQMRGFGQSVSVRK